MTKVQPVDVAPPGAPGGVPAVLGEASPSPSEAAGCRCDTCGRSFATMQALGGHRNGCGSREEHSANGYKRGCRCDVCRTAKREQQAMYKARRRAEQKAELAAARAAAAPAKPKLSDDEAAARLLALIATEPEPEPVKPVNSLDLVPPLKPDLPTRGANPSKLDTTPRKDALTLQDIRRARGWQ